jgi:hypothetical protein
MKKLKFVERATANQCFARFVVLPREFMQRLREGFERAMARTPSAASELLPWMQRHLPSIEDAWRLRDHQGVGRDCPVQQSGVRSETGGIASLNGTQSITSRVCVVTREPDGACDLLHHRRRRRIDVPLPDRGRFDAVAT